MASFSTRTLPSWNQPTGPLVAPRVLVFPRRLRHAEVVKPTFPTPLTWSFYTGKWQFHFFLLYISAPLPPSPPAPLPPFPLNLFIFSKQLYSLFTLNGMFYN